MRSTPSLLLLAALALGPAVAFAADDDEASDEKSDKRAEKKAAQDEAEEEDVEAPAATPTFLTTFPPHRYTYIAGGAFIVGGLAFAFAAQGEAKRSDTITSAVESQNALNNARASAAMSSVFWALAASTLIYAFVLEFLPEKVAEKASLTLHF
jgi:preprotein translocase subunit SecG